MKDRTERGSHPGYAIKASDNSWVTSAHGLYLAEDPFFALTYDTKESAQETLDYALQDEDLPKELTYEVVEAWIPVCEQLRFDIDQLRKANTISPDELFDIKFELENILYRLGGTE